MMSQRTPTNCPEENTLTKLVCLVQKVIIEAVSSTGGSGVSSTKIVWLSNGMLLCYSATLATIGGVAVYVYLQKADLVYWSAVAALWTASTGFALSAKKHQNLTRTGLLNANLSPKNTGTEDQR